MKMFRMQEMAHFYTISAAMDMGNQGRKRVYGRFWISLVVGMVPLGIGVASFISDPPLGTRHSQKSEWFHHE